MSSSRWRTIDIVVASTLAVAFGVIFWAWGLLWYGPFKTAFSFFPPLAGIVNGVWFIPAILAPLIIRKRGAGLFTEAVAATISAVLGATWGVLTIWYGLVEGAAGEAPFLASRYRKFTVWHAITGGALVGAFASIMDVLFTEIGDLTTPHQLVYSACQVASGAVIAGLGSYLLANALARTGVLDRFPIGKSRELV